MRDRRRISNKARDTYCPLVPTLLQSFSRLLYSILSFFFTLFFILFTIDRNDRPNYDVRRKISDRELPFYGACADHREFLATPAFPREEYEVKEIRYKPNRRRSITYRNSLLVLLFDNTYKCANRTKWQTATQPLARRTGR